jgi:TonB family protein
MLKFHKKFLFLTLSLFLQCVVIYSQNASKDKFVKWEGLSGKNGEFMVFMPEGYLAASSGEMYLGKPPGAARVEKQLKVARHLNGVVLVMEYYQGNGKDIYKTLKEREKTTFEKEGEINGFQFAHFSAKDEKSYQKTHFYYSKKGLYLLKAISRAENDKILKGFFESVRLINQNNPVAPNAPQDAKSTSLPNVIEKIAIRLDDSMAIESKEADRKMIVLSQDYPNFSFDMRRGMGNVRVKLRVLYSSSGKVSDVKVLEISSKLLEREAVEAAKRAVFIPAEKDGKLVSVYQTIEYGFGIETR